MKSKKMYIYLLAGQSNMAGRGVLPETQEVNPRILSLNKENNWEIAKDPLHWDKSVAGAGLGLTFAETILKDLPTDVTIGLVPCACGGSPIEKWEEGEFLEQTNSSPLDDTLTRMQEALKSGELKGILWHQGEGDAFDERAPLYEQRLKNLITKFRKEFKTPEAPFIIGQIGQFADNPWGELQTQIDNIHKAVAETVPYCAYVSANGLTSIGDNLHFNTESLKELGKRYAKEYLQLIVN